MDEEQKTVVIFVNKLLPVTQTFIPVQVNSLTRYRPQYVALGPVSPSLPIQNPILFSNDHSTASRVRKQMYEWSGVAPSFHREVAAARPALLHAHLAENGPLALALADSLRVPMALHLRGGVELFPDSVLWSHWYHLIYLMRRQKLWRRTSAFLCVSDYIRKKAMLSGFPKDKLKVHYTGIDLSLFTPSETAPDKDLVLYVGRLVKYKGADQLVRAMAKVRRTNPAARLAIIGEGPLRPLIESVATELSVPVEFLGHQPSAIIKSWMRQARVFCGPSITTENGMSEAFGNVFTEAQAVGTPVVSYRHGGIPETMLEGETGLLAEEGDFEGLADHISRYLTDDAYWLSSRRRAIEFTRENFDVRLQTQKLERIYDQLIRDGVA